MMKMSLTTGRSVGLLLACLVLPAVAFAAGTSPWADGAERIYAEFMAIARPVALIGIAACAICAICGVLNKQWAAYIAIGCIALFAAPQILSFLGGA